jgi:zinc/manganese transport system ATP-binding protein
MGKLNTPVVEIIDASLKRGEKLLWENLSISINHGEFIAVLGPNGSGKTSLLKVMLGNLELSSGKIHYCVDAVSEKRPQLGYIPQQKKFDSDLPISGRDLVSLGLNGNRYGLRKNTADELKIDQIISELDCESFANRAISDLSGGEQQRLRAAQAMVNNPEILLCDEPLLSLDIGSQMIISSNIDRYRNKAAAAVIFVTHEINPILPFVDKILYFAKGKWVFDTPEKILTSEVLSSLYQSKIEVLKMEDRIIIVGGDDESLTAHGHHHSHESSIGDEH